MIVSDPVTGPRALTKDGGRAVYSTREEADAAAARHANRLVAVRRVANVGSSVSDGDRVRVIATDSDWFGLDGIAKRFENTPDGAVAYVEFDDDPGVRRAIMGGALARVEDLDRDA